MADSQKKPENTASDPDAENLPPGVQLPDRKLFVKGQHLARGVTAIIALGILIAFWAVFGKSFPILNAVCAGLIVLSASYHFFRFFKPAE